MTNGQVGVVLANRSDGQVQEHAMPAGLNTLGMPVEGMYGAQEPATTIFWHRSLPPVDAILLAEHTIEADSRRVAGTLAHRDELWKRCYQELLANADKRLLQEIARLGGHYAHVHHEAIGPKRDNATGEAWLHGCFTYSLFRRPES